MKISRRQFLEGAGAAGAYLALGNSPLQLRTLEPVVHVGNPLEQYPSREWEKIYHDQYRYDSSFTYICAPNDTHNCRVRAFVRNGIVVRVEQNYDHQSYGDLYGNKASRNWNPRMCLKGYTLHRRVYGPYRLRYPMVRKGWREWADAGFPPLDQEKRKQFRFDARGLDDFLRITWDQALTYAAQGLMAIARTYSGEEGKKRLQNDGYPPEMLEHWKGAGTRTMKFRGGMGLLGVIGKYGMYRLANTMAILDSLTRNVPHEQALGGRNWSNYTWHGDQAPGQPFVHGLQASDIDFNDLRFSKLTIQVGKNLIENKMPEAHWLVEVIERGGKFVVISPEYNPPATKADYWIPIRPGLSDTAIFLGIAKVLMDEGWYDKEFVKKFTDFPLLVRTDTLKRLKAHETFPGYKNKDLSRSASMTVQGLTGEQREQLGDFVIYDAKSMSFKAVSRDDVGEQMTKLGIDPVLEGKFTVKTTDGKEIEVIPLFEMYKIHLKDYDLDTVQEISNAPKDLVMRLARDIATTRPVSIHFGEGINHWFHATLHNRATYLPLILTGNIGTPGSGCHTWAGNYKSANFQASSWSGPGFKGWVAEDPFALNLDPSVDGKQITAHAYSYDEEVGYWAHGDLPLIVRTPKHGRKVFTGKTHMPSPTKMIWTTNVNLINNAKWAYEIVKNVNPKVDMIVTQDIEMTGSCEYSDLILPANSWMEFQALEITSSCSNPFLQIWGSSSRYGANGIKPLYDTRDDLLIMAGVAEKLSLITGDKRFGDYWKFALEGREDVYIQRLLDSSTTTRGYKVKEILDGKYGEPGAALLLYRTYPRVPFWEQVHESVPFYTPTGRLQAYNDEPEVIEYGENFIVHREGPEATPYLPNVIVSTNPYIRPEDYGIPPDHLGWEERTVRNIKLGWEEVKKTENPLWRKGYTFYCVTPKSRHTVHSSWAVTDWNFIWSNNFGDPYRMDKRTPGVGEWQMHMNPQAAKELGLNDGDYAYVDANPADRPYIGATPADPFYKVARLMVRVKYNPAYPYHLTMMKHSAFMSTERTVKAHESRKDGLALSALGYQSNFRYGSQQSITRSWLMPMHQLDSLFHKSKTAMKFVYGFEGDNHGINSVPKELLIKVTKAEDGGMGGKGIWDPAATGFSPGNEKAAMQGYLLGKLTTIRKA